MKMCYKSWQRPEMQYCSWSVRNSWVLFNYQTFSTTLWCWYFISRHTVAEWFAPFVLCIIDAILQQKKAGLSISVSRTPCSLLCSVLKCFQHVVMVGGFACSEWLCERVKRCLTPLGLNVFCSETHVLVTLFVLQVWFFLLNYWRSATRQFPMVPFHSTLTTMFHLAFRDIHLVFTFMIFMIPLTQNISNVYEPRWSILTMKRGFLVCFLLSYRK